MAAGIACGAGAGALWGLVFLAPELVAGFSPLQLTIGRYLAYGAISAALIAPRWSALRHVLGRDEWIMLAWLALAGNTFYYILLAAAVQIGGMSMTSLVIGFLPVVVTIAGSRDRGAVPLRQLLPSLLMCAAGVICIGWGAIVSPSAGSVAQQVIGLVCAAGALASWAWFAVGNSRALTRVRTVSAHEWSLLIGLVTGAQALILIPFSIAFESMQHAAVDWAKLAGVSIGVAVLASILGNALWNRMSRLLPLTMAGQMILFETLFALLYGFLWEQRWPRALEVAAFGLVAISVLSCIAAHRGHQRDVAH
ncbi:multidrug DMT transporter permease [Bosea sp. Root381]|nr:multidrug DMT transporter permease [Bosea sp. Root381]